MRLIEADALITRMNERAEEEYLDFRDCRDMAEFAPTVDAVPVIRCKDCKYAVDEYDDGECYCDNKNNGLIYIGKDWGHYCSWAERKEE